MGTYQRVVQRPPPAERRCARNASSRAAAPYGNVVHRRPALKTCVRDNNRQPTDVKWAAPDQLLTMGRANTKNCAPSRHRNNASHAYLRFYVARRSSRQHASKMGGQVGPEPHGKRICPIAHARNKTCTPEGHTIVPAGICGPDLEPTEPQETPLLFCDRNHPVHNINVRLRKCVDTRWGNGHIRRGVIRSAGPWSHTASAPEARRRN